MYIFIFSNGESYGIVANSMEDAMNKFNDRWFDSYFEKYNFQVVKLNGYES